MNCPQCGKKLRIDNTTGFCYKHRRMSKVHVEKQKEYREKNKERLSEAKKIYTQNHKEEKRAYDVEYYKRNYDRIKKNRDKYRSENKDRRNKNEKDRRKTDIEYKLKHYLRTRVGKVIRRQQKVGSAVEDLGCTGEEFITYLESKFKPGMSWDNYGTKGWHVDHIIPLNKFDLSDREQFLRACHYTNLQPLWEGENCSKRDRVL